MTPWAPIGLVGQLPVLQDRPEYHDARGYYNRILDGITGVTYHYTAGYYSTGVTAVRNIALYQISDNAIPQTGAGMPFPGIAYTLVVDAAGNVFLCWPLNVRTWHSSATVGGIARNASHVGIVYLGSGAPKIDQLDGLAKATIWCEQQLGRVLTSEGHKDSVSTTCPFGWPKWKVEVDMLVAGYRNG